MIRFCGMPYIIHIFPISHYGDVVISTIASQITSVSMVYSSVCSDADQRKHQSSASLAFVRGIHRWPVNSPHKGPVTRTCFQLMTSSWRWISCLHYPINARNSIPAYDCPRCQWSNPERGGLTYNGNSQEVVICVQLNIVVDKYCYKIIRNRPHNHGKTKYGNIMNMCYESYY